MTVGTKNGVTPVEVLDRLVEERGAPEYIRSDNGPEFVKIGRAHV